MDGFLKRENLTAILSVRVCHFTKEDFKGALLEYWSELVTFASYGNPSQVVQNIIIMIGGRKLNQAIYRRLSLLCANKRSSIEAMKRFTLTI